MELNGTIFVQIAIFMGLLLWLSRSLFDPIFKLMDAREERIEGSKKIARDLLSESQKKSAEFEQEFSKAKEDAKKMLSDIKNQAEKEHKSFLDDLKNEAKSKVNEAEQLAAVQGEQLRRDLEQTSSVIAKDVISALYKNKADLA